MQGASWVQGERACAAFARMNELGGRRKPFLFVLDYRLREPLVMTAEEIPPDVRFALPGVSTGVRGFEATSSGPMAGPPPAIGAVAPVSFERYRRGFELVQEAQREGYSYLVNLTYPTEIELSGTLDTVFEQARAPYRLKLGDRFVVFSPEPFVRIAGSSISTFPMKGTREVGAEGVQGAGTPARCAHEVGAEAAYEVGAEAAYEVGAEGAREVASDAGPDERQARRELHNDEKEAAEHATVVDLLRNDLGRVSNRVRVPRYRYIERLTFPDKVLLAASSEITGELEGDWRARLGDIYRELLPAGSITGAPKDSTCRIIEEAEGYDRGFYTGVFGWFDGQSVESAVMIRVIESHAGRFRFKSGGGITIYSDCAREYRELVQKVAIPLESHGGARSTRSVAGARGAPARGAPARGAGAP